ncbi:MAG: gene transfer agent family protein [Pseudomonadota bacterium]
MANAHRGEVSAFLDGERRTLCLTLGALAHLEEALGADDLMALAERFAHGRMKAQDAIAIIGAGLRGGGTDVSDADVAKMAVEGGAAGYVTIVSDLLTATFGSSDT